MKNNDQRGESLDRFYNNYFYYLTQLTTHVTFHWLNWNNYKKNHILEKIQF